MCGLLGWSLNRNLGRKGRKIMRRVFRELAWAMRDRGEDAWGLIVDDEVRCGPGPMPYRIDDVPQTLLGHTRFATTGRRGLAHPLILGDLKLMHNGQVYNHAQLNLTHGRDCEIDSEHILRHIAENRDLTELQGYGAIQLWDSGSVYIGGSPLVVVQTKVGIIWASTDEVHDACEWSGLRVLDELELNPQTLYLADSGELWDSRRRFVLGQRETKISVASWPPDEWEGYGRNYTYGE